MSTARIKSKLKLEPKTNSYGEVRALEILNKYSNENLEPELLVQGYYSPRAFNLSLHNGEIKSKSDEQNDESFCLKYTER